MAKAPEHLAHLEWLGYVQPVGLVVSIPALLVAQAYVNRNIGPDHARFRASLSGDGEAGRADAEDATPPALDDFPAFARTVLGWESTDLVGGPGADPLPASLEVVLPEYHETLRPTYAVREFKPKDPARPWLMLVQILPAGTALDEDAAPDDARHWQASPQAKFERLLRETQVPIGLLVSPAQVRLVYAPRGETSGHATFDVAAMASVAGRPIFAALHMLLSAERLFTLSDKQRLPAILADSRRYQNTVSTQLAEQVLAALYELVRGFQAADDARKGELLRAVLAADPNHVYAGLLTVLMRLVFVLFAEDRGLLSADPLYTNHYSVTGLFNRLRADAGRYPDTMNQRYGAWAQLLTLFRLVYDGGRHGGFKLLARKGYLFDPDRYPFLEGRGVLPSAAGSGRDPARPTDVPRVSDGVVYAVLSNLLVLDGERLNYRSLDVQHIGSVYEAMMGFDLHVAAGRSIAIKPAKSHGAPASVNLDELLTVKPADRAKWLAERTDQKLTGQAADALKKADTLDALLAALEKRVAKRVTDRVVPAGAMVLQPSDERRRSGSHYTPRSLTEPIVARTFEPIFARLSEKSPPKPEQILDLKVCDPAMGSGAFLVEACQQLGDALVKAWHAHGKLPADIPPDEDAVLHARRLVAQRCLYGVDRNPMAVDLAKLSLWLATLAKDHPFTFLDHSLRHGDSLVGLTREQIEGFHWSPTGLRTDIRQMLNARMERVSHERRRILDAGDVLPPETKRSVLELAEEQMELPRTAGNAVVAAFFAADRDKERNATRLRSAGDLDTWLQKMSHDARARLNGAVNPLVSGDRSIRPFHWQIEFPEVFDRQDGGFDVIVGNPPFAGKNTIGAGNREGYLDWLKSIHAESHGNADLVAHFFRRSFDLLRPDGTFGLIATNTIAQGDTRGTGLRWICTHGGTIYSARRRYKWPGVAAVVVSVVNVIKGHASGPLDLDGRAVDFITAYLFHAGGHESPSPLRANAGKSFQGSIVLGMGFTFDDTDASGVANPVRLMHELIERDPRNASRIFPFIGWDEVTNDPEHRHNRFAIDLGEPSLEEAAGYVPDLIELLRTKVKPERDKHLRSTNLTSRRRAERWWIHGSRAKDLYDSIAGMDRVIVTASQAMAQYSMAFLPVGQIYSSNLTVIAHRSFAAFCALQSRLHETWVRFHASSLEDRLCYPPTDCYQTFPFPEEFDSQPALEVSGRTYCELRTTVMASNLEGLTQTYNRFQDPSEPSADIRRLRDLHAKMDRAVLNAFGWSDLRPECGFGLDYLDLDDDADPPEDTPATLWWPTAAEALDFAARLPDSGVRRRRLPWRHRWADDVRDEVLARLLALNQQRAEAERLSGESGVGGKGPGKPPGNGPTKPRGRGKSKAVPTVDGVLLPPDPVQGMLPGMGGGEPTGINKGGKP